MDALALYLLQTCVPLSYDHIVDAPSAVPIARHSSLSLGKTP